MHEARRPRDRNDFDIAIICALQIESDAVEALFDEIWEGDCAYGKAPTDPNSYTTGRIGDHDAVLAFMPGMGKGTAASVAANFRSSFSRINLGLVVGICGGVPIGMDKKEILLGDVVISTGLVQYDFGRQLPDKFVMKDTLEDNLGRPNSEIRAFLKKMAGFRSRQLLANRTSTFIDELCNKEGLEELKYPGANEDKLYEPIYRHRHQGLTSCPICAKCKSSKDEVCKDALKFSCSVLGCSDDRQVPRNRLRNAKPTAASGTGEREAVKAQVPLIHFGRIASGDLVMKSGSHRDEVASREEVIAFEMEGAGVWDNFPTIVIKAICDYADSHKNKRWQGYAAAAAAACMKALLKEWRIADKREKCDAEHYVPQPYWTVPFERNAHFVGRDSQLQELRAKLFAEDRCQKVAIYGLGGVGKTQVVLELAYRTRVAHPDYSIFWIPASSIEKFEQAYLEIGELLQIPGVSEEKADVKQLVKQKLSQEITGRWLLILDNADDADAWFKKVSTGPQPTRLIDCLPRSNKGSLIFTTRDRKSALMMAPPHDVIEVREMDETVAIDLFKELLLHPNVADDRKIRLKLLDRLTYLPLAIVQATAYINANDSSVVEYLSLFEDAEENVVEVLSEDFEDGGRYEESKNPVTATWLISFEQIRHRDPLAAEYLSYMSCLDASRIPKSLLPPAQPKRVVDAIGTLVAYSFVTKRDMDISLDQSSTVDQVFDLHRLVHLATRNWLRQENSLAGWTEKVVTRLAEIFPSYNHRNKVIWTTYLPHAYCVLKSGTIVQDMEERITLLQKVGLCLLAEGRYSEAEAPFLQGLETRKRVLGEEHPDTLTSMTNLASTYQNQGRWKEAEELDVQVMGMRKRVLGEEHPDTLTSMGNLASTYRYQGRWKDAEKLEVQVMETRKRVLGEEHPDTLTSIGNLASTFWNRGRWKDAEELEVQVMGMRKRVMGEEHPDTLTSMGNLASTYQNQGRWKDAEELFIQVMETSSRVLGEEHPDTLTSMGNLASTYRNQGRWKDAEELFIQVMETSSRVLGEEHPHTLTSIGNLASTYGNQGRWKEAEELEVHVMETSSRVLGEEHPDTLACMNNLARTWKYQNHDKEARELMTEVVEVSKRTIGFDHPYTRVSIQTLDDWSKESQEVATV